MGPILGSSFNDCIANTFRCLVNLIKLWNVKIVKGIRKEFIQIFGSFYPSTIFIFSFEIILFDNDALTTFQIFLLLQTVFPFNLLKYSLLLFHKSVTHKLFCLVYLPLFSSVLFSRKIFLSFVPNIISSDKLLFIKGE